MTVAWILGTLALLVALTFAVLAIREELRDAADPSAPPHLRGERAHLPARAPRSFARFHRKLRRDLRHEERATRRLMRGGHLR